MLGGRLESMELLVPRLAAMVLYSSHTEGLQ